MSKILSIRARQILDSRGMPTVECDVHTRKGVFRASVPSGASTGAHEAVELRDGTHAYHGKGVAKAVRNVNTVIAKKVIGMNCLHQRDVDETLIALDGTPTKKKLGANALLAVSMAVCRAGAADRSLALYQHIADLYGSKKVSLPIPSFNIINGGKHAGNELNIQEYMIQPHTKRFSEALRAGVEIYQELRTILQRVHGKSAINVGDEGGFAPALKRADQPFDYIMKAIARCGYQKEMRLGIDAAATSFWKHGAYQFEGRAISSQILQKRYEEWSEEYPLDTIEDPFHQEDFESFAHLTSKLKHCTIIADDLTVTNPRRISKAIRHGSANGLLLKLNQIGTVSQAFDAAQLARKHKWSIMVGHRSGETTDSFIADLAVGIGSKYIKAGAPCRGERLAKYNRLLRIEEELHR